MLTPQRRHDHARVNARINARVKPYEVYRNEDRRASSYSWWNVRGLGRFWKHALNKARRAHAKAQIRGQRGSEPSYLESTVNWRAD